MTRFGDDSDVGIVESDSESDATDMTWTSVRAATLQRGNYRSESGRYYVNRHDTAGRTRRRISTYECTCGAVGLPTVHTGPTRRARTAMAEERINRSAVSDSPTLAGAAARCLLWSDNKWKCFRVRGGTMLTAARQLLASRGPPWLHGWATPSTVSTVFDRRTDGHLWPWDCRPSPEDKDPLYVNRTDSRTQTLELKRFYEFAAYRERNVYPDSGLRTIVFWIPFTKKVTSAPYRLGDSAQRPVKRLRNHVSASCRKLYSQNGEDDVPKGRKCTAYRWTLQRSIVDIVSPRCPGHPLPTFLATPLVIKQLSVYPFFMMLSYVIKFL